MQGVAPCPPQLWPRAAAVLAAIFRQQGTQLVWHLIQHNGRPLLDGACANFRPLEMHLSLPMLSSSPIFRSRRWQAVLEIFLSGRCLRAAELLAHGTMRKSGVCQTAHCQSQGSGAMINYPSNAQPASAPVAVALRSTSASASACQPKVRVNCRPALQHWTGGMDSSGCASSDIETVRRTQSGYLVHIHIYHVFDSTGLVAGGSTETPLTRLGMAAHHVEGLFLGLSHPLTWIIGHTPQTRLANIQAPAELRPVSKDHFSTPNPPWRKYQQQQQN